MDNKAWDLLLEDIKEIREDVKEIRKDVGKVKIRLASFGAVFGVVGAYLQKYIHKIF